MFIVNWRAKEGGRVALLCSHTGSMWASRPPLQSYRINVGESPTFAAIQDQCGRVAFLYSNTGSMWAGRPPLQERRIKVGESLSFTATQDQCGRVAHTPIALNCSSKPHIRDPCLLDETACRLNRDFATNRR